MSVFDMRLLIYTIDIKYILKNSKFTLKNRKNKKQGNKQQSNHHKKLIKVMQQYNKQKQKNV